LLDEKIHPVEIVKRLKLAPDVIESLQEQWAHLKGGFVDLEVEVAQAKARRVEDLC